MDFETLFAISGFCLFGPTYLAVLYSLSLKAKQFVPRQIRSMVQDRTKFKYCFQHWFTICINSIYLVRFIYVMLSILQPKVFPSQKWWLWYCFFRQFDDKEQTDRYFGLIFIVVLLFALAVEPTLYFADMETTTVQLYYDILVLNGDIYQQCLKQPLESRVLLLWKIAKRANKLKKGSIYSFSCSQIVLKPLVEFSVKYQSWSRGDYVDKVRFMRQTLPHYPTLSFRTRNQIFILVFCINRIGHWVYCLLGNGVF